MPKPHYMHMQKQITRHGKVVWYVRINRGKRIRIHGDYGSVEFNENYRAAIAGEHAPGKAKEKSGSFAWLVSQYRKSADWLQLSQATRRQRENILKHVLDKAGKRPFTAFTRKIITASRDERAATPAQAGNFLKTMNGLFKWALEAEYIKVNPCIGIKPLKRLNNGGFAVWTEVDVDNYQHHWPIGTKERVWLDLILYTGLRRGDAVSLGRQHVRDGVAFLKTEKSGFTTEVAIPILAVLQKTLDAGPTADLAFICGANGQPLTKESFGNMFREACRAAGVEKSAHGVRKISATRAAEAGATVAQLKALFGWTDDEMPSLYTKSADRRKLAREAIHKLEKANKG